MTLALAIALALGACGDDAGTDSDGAGAGGTGGAGGSGGSGGEQDSGVAGTGGTGGSGGSGGTGGTGGTGGSGGTGGADAVDPTPFAGNWTGGWTNTTFGSMGDATLEVTPDTSAMTVTFTIDLDGNVFGGSNPPAETFTGPYDADGYTVSGTSATFGTLTLSISESGAITGSATPSRGATTFTGTASESELTINYTIEDAPNPDITGVLTFTK